MSYKQLSSWWAGKHGSLETVQPHVCCYAMNLSSGREESFPAVPTSLAGHPPPPWSRTPCWHPLALLRCQRGVNGRNVIALIVAQICLFYIWEKEKSGGDGWGGWTNELANLLCKKNHQFLKICNMWLAPQMWPFTLSTLWSGTRNARWLSKALQMARMKRWSCAALTTDGCRLALLQFSSVKFREE